MVRLPKPRKAKVPKAPKSEVPRKTGGTTSRARLGQKWTWKQYTIIIVVVAALVGGISLAGGAGPVTSGFMTVSTRAVNGYRVGSLSGQAGSNVGFGTDGRFVFPDASGTGVMWQGYVKIGNVYQGAKTFLGWQQIGNASIAIYSHTFTFDLLAYTTSTTSDIIPHSAATTSRLQYSYSRAGLFGDQIESQSSYLNLGYLSLASNWMARAGATLNLNVEFEMQLDPTLLGQGIPQTLEVENGTYSVVGFWAGVLKTDSLGQQDAGYLTQPGMYLKNGNFSTSGASSASKNLASATGGASPNTAVATDIGTAMAKADGLSTMAGHFGIAWSSSANYAGTGQYAALNTAGTTIPLYDAENNAAVQGDMYKNSLLGSVRSDVVGSVPFLLQPRTEITSTAYTYKEWAVHSADYLDWFTVRTSTAAQYQTKTVSLPTLINTQNVYAIAKQQATVLVATNYTWTPLQACDDPSKTCYVPPITPPSINGTNGSIDPTPTQYVSAAGGNVAQGMGLLDRIGAFLLEYWWVCAIIGLVAVAVIVSKVRGPRVPSIQVMQVPPPQPPQPPQPYNPGRDVR